MIDDLVALIISGIATIVLFIFSCFFGKREIIGGSEKNNFLLIFDNINLEKFKDVKFYSFFHAKLGNNIMPTPLHHNQNYAVIKDEKHIIYTSSPGMYEIEMGDMKMNNYSVLIIKYRKVGNCRIETMIKLITDNKHHEEIYKNFITFVNVPFTPVSEDENIYLKQILEGREMVPVINFNIEYFLTHKYALSVKRDGVPNYLVLTHGCIFIGNKYFSVVARTKSKHNIVAIGEYVKDAIYLFDILFDEVDLRDKPFETRYLERVGKVVDKFKNDNLNVIAQSFIYDTELTRVHIQNALEIRKNLKGPSDGIIFQVLGTSYDKQFTMKWKLKEENTIDVLVVNGETFYSDGGGSICKNTERLGIKKIINEDLYRLPSKLFIGEFQVHPNFRYVRPRYDKSVANAKKTIKDIQNVISRMNDETSLLGNDDIYLAQIHRMFTSKYLLSNFKQGMTVLDIGAGIGSDWHTWKSLDLKDIFAIEPNQKSFEKLKERELSNLHCANMGGENPELSKVFMRDVKVDGIIMNYSLSFFFKSSDMLGALFNNIQNLTKPGSILIIAFMDNLDSLIDKTNEFKAGVPTCLTIKRNYSKKATFGSQLNIHMTRETTKVSEQIEYNVDAAELISTAKEFDFKVEKDGHLSDMYGNLYRFMDKKLADFSKCARFIIFKRY